MQKLVLLRRHTRAHLFLQSPLVVRRAFPRNTKNSSSRAKLGKEMPASSSSAFVLRTASREIVATAVRRNANRACSCCRRVSSRSLFTSLSVSLSSKTTVYELAKTLPQYGIGHKFTKTNWERKGTTKSEKSQKFPPTFWTLTKILPKANGRTGHGAYGILTWKGRRRATEEKIGGTHKTVWKIVDDDEFGGIEEVALKLALPDEAAEEEAEETERGK